MVKVVDREWAESVFKNGPIRYGRHPSRAHRLVDFLWGAAAGFVIATLLAGIGGAWGRDLGPSSWLTAADGLALANCDKAGVCACPKDAPNLRSVKVMGVGCQATFCEKLSCAKADASCEMTPAMCDSCVRESEQQCLTDKQLNDAVKP